MLNVAKTLCGAMLLAILLPYGMAAAQATATPLTRAQFDAMLARVDNSSRWGAQDELGTLNLITPSVRRAAASQVREGISISLAREVTANAKAMIQRRSSSSIFRTVCSGRVTTQCGGPAKKSACSIM